MKSNVNRGSLTPRFPTLAIHPRTEMVVLFTSESEGFSLTEGDDIKAWSYEHDFISVDDQEEWTILPPGYKVILENGA